MKNILLIITIFVSVFVFVLNNNTSNDINIQEVNRCTYDMLNYDNVECD